MEAWLKSENGSFRFPFVPQSIPLSDTYNVVTETLSNGNEISFYGGKGLRKTTLSAHFPSDSDRTYLDSTDIQDPNECVRIIDAIAQSKGEIRYIVTKTGINMPVKIQSFEHNIIDATGDIHFTLSMVEYNPPKAKSWTPPQISEPKQVKKTGTKEAKKIEKKLEKKKESSKSVKRAISLKNNRNFTKKIPKVYRSSKKENIYDIAHKTTGNTRNYKNIIAVNTFPGNRFHPVLRDALTLKIPLTKNTTVQPRMYNPILNSYGAVNKRSRFGGK